MEVLQRYAELGMFEEALYAAEIFQEDMTVIFTQLVGMCIRLSRGETLYVIQSTQSAQSP
jgi:hypothetical protein